MNSDLAAQIRSHKPGGAKAYFLWNFDQRFPTTGGFSTEPLTLPFGLQPGEYKIGFLSDIAGGQSIASNNPSNPTPTVKITAEAGVALAPGKPAAPEKPAKIERIDPLDLDPVHLKHRVEYEAIRMADQTVKNKQLLPRQGLRTREIGEGFVLNRAWRQETEQLVRMLGATHRQSLEQSQQTLAQAKLAAQHMIEAGKAMPQPAPDHMTPFLGLMGQVVGMIGGALSGRSRRAGKGEEILEALIGANDEDGEQETDSPARQALKAMKEELARTKKRLAAKKAAIARAAAKKDKPKGKKKPAPPTKKPAKKKAKPDPKKKTSAKAKPKTPPKPARRSGSSDAAKRKGAEPKKTKQLPAKGAR